MDIWIISSAVLAAGILWVAFAVPADYLHGYANWVREKHGDAMNISFGVLLAAVGIPFALTLENPGKYPAMELMVMLLIPVMIGIVAWDNYRFWRDAYHHR